MPKTYKMKEQLISFETAKIAKEKDCNLSSYWWYNLGEGGKLSCDPKNGYGYQQEQKGLMVYTYTQSLLQKWLRERYGIHIVVIPTITSNWTFKTVRVLSELDDDVIIGLKSVSDLPPYKDVNGYDYSTYEDALEEALKESLNTLP